MTLILNVTLEELPSLIQNVDKGVRVVLRSLGLSLVICKRSLTKRVHSFNLEDEKTLLCQEYYLFYKYE